MLTALILSVLLPVLAVLAQPTPQEPAPNSIFKEGDQCPITWSIDPSGTWTTMNIELMSGDNLNMQYLTTVATVDGTKQTSFSYACPKVTVHSNIYFYQFSTSVAPLNSTWTGRFTITDASGQTTPPTQNTNGIAWGNGALADPGSAGPKPSYLTNPNAVATPTSSQLTNSTGTLNGTSSGLLSPSPSPSSSPLPKAKGAQPGQPGSPAPPGPDGAGNSQPTDAGTATGVIGAANGSGASPSTSPSANAAKGAVALMDMRVFMGVLLVGALSALGNFVVF